MKFELTKEESDIILNSLPEKRYLSEIDYLISTRGTISDRKNPTGELLPREVDCFKLKIHKGGYRYVYEHNIDEWKPIFNIVKIKIREEKLKELGI
jgi:hypothetical protein